MPSRRQTILDSRTGYRNPLNASQQKFVQNYLTNLNADEAAAAAGYKEEGAGGRLLTTPIVAAAIALLHQQRSVRTDIYADEVLQRWWLLATADPNEITQLRRVNCRYCYGINYGYQRTAGEIERDLEAHQAKVAKAKRTGATLPEPFEEKGGDGFRPWGDPNEDCPECGGLGEPKVYLLDSRTLSPAGRALYASVEQGRDGSVKVNLKNQEAALLNVAKHLGMHVERKEISGPAGEPLEIIVKVVRPGPFIEGDVTEAIEAAD